MYPESRFLRRESFELGLKQLHVCLDLLDFRVVGIFSFCLLYANESLSPSLLLYVKHTDIP